MCVNLLVVCMGGRANGWVCAGVWRGGLRALVLQVVALLLMLPLAGGVVNVVCTAGLGRQM